MTRFGVCVVAAVCIGLAVVNGQGLQAKEGEANEVTTVRSVSTMSSMSSMSTMSTVSKTGTVESVVSFSHEHHCSGDDCHHHHGDDHHHHGDDHHHGHHRHHDDHHHEHHHGHHHGPMCWEKIVKGLRERLQLAGEELGESAFAKPGEHVTCTCEDYCTGQCFAPSCVPCSLDTFSVPDGEFMCLDPGPLGTGLLCQKPQAPDAPASAPCCSTALGSSCQLPADSCCSSGDCSTCPAPNRTMHLFPPLFDLRHFDPKTNKCEPKKTPMPPPETQAPEIAVS